MPAGPLVMVPLPFFLLAFTTFRVRAPARVALTVLVLSMTMLQDPVPEHAPLQPVKTLFHYANGDPGPVLPEAVNSHLRRNAGIESSLALIRESCPEEGAGRRQP